MESPWSYLLHPQAVGPVQVRLDALAQHEGPALVAHVGRVATQAARMALALNLPPVVIEESILVGWLHEIGRTEGNPPPGERHETAAALLRDLPGLVAVSRSVRCLAERWDGEGGPDGLHDYQIPLSARLVAVADVMDNLLHGTADRGALAPAIAADWLRRQGDYRFDPVIVDVGIAMLAAPIETIGDRPVLSQ